MNRDLPAAVTSRASRVASDAPPPNRADERLVEEFIPFMRNVGQCERRMGELNFTWSLIESTAKMTCPVEAKTILPTMAATRHGFGKLERQLIENLVRENLRKVQSDITARAQVVVDILIRNLYERTADVGFLATDDEIRAFVRECEGAADTPPKSIGAIRRRLEEYRAKYTVYDEIVILDRDGRVLANLDAKSEIARSSDALIRETLASDSFVETYRPSDLRPGQPRALLYSRRIDDPSSGQAIGVLVLSFRFDDEMAGIFKSLRSGADRSVMLLLDPSGTVIASSDEDHVALGRRIDAIEDATTRTIVFAGREYLARTCVTRGYQGYFGLGWRGHVMVPLDGAFRRTSADALDAIDPNTLGGVLGHAGKFAPALAGIADQADRINLSLRRVVWNGQIMAAGKRGDLLKLKSILQQISETGTRTSTLFATSIRDLYGTVVSASLDDTQSIARLAIDIMDRNLYERADDCRWWALSSSLRTTLAKPTREPAERAKMEATLEYINGLYTVYTRLVVYDRTGTIVAASNLAKDGLEAVGRSIDPAIVQQVMQLRSSQQYVVGAFAPSWLYGDKPTYMYHAAIRHPEHAGVVVGGIGIVFDAAPQFEAMLADSLPAKEGAFGLFVDRQGGVIASTSAGHPVGSVIELDAQFLALANGEGRSALIEHRGSYYVLGVSTSAGYREYKTTGDYQNDVVALVFVPVGEARANAPTLDASSLALAPGGAQGSGPQTEIAAFLIGDQVFGLPAAEVIEAVEPVGLVAVRESRRFLAGLITYQSSGDEAHPVVPVVDMRFVLGLPAAAASANQQIIVVRTPRGPLGLLVDDLVDVLEYESHQLEPVLPAIERFASFIKSIIKAGSGTNTRLLLLIEAAKLFEAAQAAG